MLTKHLLRPGDHIQVVLCAGVFSFFSFLFNVIYFYLFYFISSAFFLCLYIYLYIYVCMYRLFCRVSPPSYSPIMGKGVGEQV